MSDQPAIPGPHYTLHEALATCLALAQRALLEVRSLARMPGPQGVAGEKGEPGRNASDLVALQEHIDERIDRMFKAATVTTQDGGRTMQITLGGVLHEIKTATVLDAGVWKEGTYQRGDGVTLGGSFFIAQADTTAKPGKSDDWRLAVKCGRDGRDTKPDEKRPPEPVRFK